ncbi:hypothetical protein PV328_011189 [Microctonus aethiopoides]|uniref:Uncharacterized protein n=1 Tax=Microctonus aethiopoides TaxID=144406 RepID=A0AA39C4U4_9HYME|nr:hypothetical protein PV328_011189 [Microctonus aethiopoides]
MRDFGTRERHFISVEGALVICPTPENQKEKRVANDEVKVGYSTALYWQHSGCQISSSSCPGLPEFTNSIIAF